MLDVNLQSALCLPLLGEIRHLKTEANKTCPCWGDRALKNRNKQTKLTLVGEIQHLQTNQQTKHPCWGDMALKNKLTLVGEIRHFETNKKLGEIWHLKGKKKTPQKEKKKKTCW